MRKVFSTSLFAAATLLLEAGCHRAPIVEKPRALVALFTVAGRQDTQLIAEGARLQLSEYGIDTATQEAASFEAFANAFKDALARVPTVAVFPNASPEAGKTLADAAYSYSVRSLLIGTDSPISPRTEHLGPDIEGLARRIVAESNALVPGARRLVLFARGACLLDVDALLFHTERSALDKRMAVALITNTPPPPREPNTVVVAVGPEAAETPSAALIVDGGEKGLQRVRGGSAAVALEPNWFQAGVRAARMIREAVGTGWLGPKRGPVSVDRVTKANLDSYLAKRKVLPPPDPPRVSPDLESGT
ncbi:MAG: hypothetical protein HRF45_08800 [Fimbriimonadia bacterium]|jgi:hypothetical protein